MNIDCYSYNTLQYGTIRKEERILTLVARHKGAVLAEQNAAYERDYGIDTTTEVPPALPTAILDDTFTQLGSKAAVGLYVGI